MNTNSLVLAFIRVGCGVSTHLTALLHLSALSLTTVT